MKHETRIATALIRCSLVCAGTALGGTDTCPHVGEVSDDLKISEGIGGFTGELTPSQLINDDFPSSSDAFGRAVASIGDVNADGIVDLAVGAPGDDDGADFVGAPHLSDYGAVWILFLDASGEVQSHQKISGTDGGFVPGPFFEVSGGFGAAVAGLGDLDGDGVPDIAAGIPGNSIGASDLDRVWVLFLNADGTVKAQQEISATAGGLVGPLDTCSEGTENFGYALAGLGDLDGDGSPDLAVGARNDCDGGSSNNGALGAVYILFLNPDGTVKGEQKVSATQGGFTGDLEPFDQFGYSVASLADLDGDGITDLAVGVYGDDDGGGDNVSDDKGAVYILFLNANGTVHTTQKISDTAGGFEGDLEDDASFGGTRFGGSVGGIGDLDGDGIVDMVVGETEDEEGAYWIVLLNPDGTVEDEFRLTETQLSFPGIPGYDSKSFARGIALLPDKTKSGGVTVALGYPSDIDAAEQTVGGVRIVTLAACTACPADVTGDGVVDSLDLNGVLAAFGSAGELAGDVTGDGVVDSLDLNAVLAAFGGGC